MEIGSETLFELRRKIVNDLLIACRKAERAIFLCGKHKGSTAELEVLQNYLVEFENALQMLGVKHERHDCLNHFGR
jgi:glutamyl-tRNA reductase